MDLKTMFIIWLIVTIFFIISSTCMGVYNHYYAEDEEDKIDEYKITIGIVSSVISFISLPLYALYSLFAFGKAQDDVYEPLASRKKK